MSGTRKEFSGLYRGKEVILLDYDWRRDPADAQGCPGRGFYDDSDKLLGNERGFGIDTDD